MHIEKRLQSKATLPYWSRRFRAHVFHLAIDLQVFQLCKIHAKDLRAMLVVHELTLSLTYDSKAHHYKHMSLGQLMCVIKNVSYVTWKSANLS